jgi:phosphoribosylanthranilate isomerase
MDNVINLKVCGMREEQNILDVAALSPEYMGFIFYSKSPRYVGENFKIRVLPASVKRVGVFVNESTDQILKQAQEHELAYIQLHGTESIEQCRQLKRHDLKIIKVFSVDDSFDFEQTRLYQEVADYFLFDTKGKYYGGNAQVFNWSILNRYDQQIPFFLSGGISPDKVINVNELQGMNIHAIDVNSGVEVIPGLKDIQKIKQVKKILTPKF